MIAIPTLDFSSIDALRFRDFLRNTISVFNEIDQSLQHRVVDFLLTGQDAEVLLDMRDALRRPDRPKFFKPDEKVLTPINFKLSCKLLKLFNQPVTPVDYYQRLGQVCSQYPDLNRGQYGPDERLPKWFNDLIRFAVSLFRRADASVTSEEKRCELGPMLDNLSDDEQAELLRVMLDDLDGDRSRLRYAIEYFGGTRIFIEKHINQLMAIVAEDGKLHEPLIRMVSSYCADPRHQLAKVIDCGLAVSRSTKSDFQTILEKRRAAAKPLLLHRLIDGTPAQRTRAAQWLNKLYGRAIAADLGKALTLEKDRKVRATIDQLYSVYREAEEYEQALARDLTLPPVEMPVGVLPLPPGFAVKFQAFLDEALARSREQYKHALHSYATSEQPDLKSARTRPASPSPDEMLALYLFIEGKSAEKPPKNDWLYQVLQEAPSIDLWCQPRELQLLHVMRLLDAIGSLQERSSAMIVYHFGLLNAHRLAQAVPYGLREIDVAIELLVGRPNLISRGYLMEGHTGRPVLEGRAKGPSRYDMEDAAVWPAFVDQLKLIEDSIAGVPLDEYDRGVTNRRQTALEIASMLPVLPKKIEEAIWNLALNDGCTLRSLARPFVKRQANCLQRAIAGLGHRSGGARTGAAELLQESGQPEAIEPLKKALRKEKHRAVQGPLLTALDKLGANLDEFIGRDILLQAANEADKRPTNSMYWFPHKALPTMRWAADNEPLPAVVLEWFMIQCVGFKSTTCSPIMRRTLGMCRRDDTLRLAHFILEKWISFDTNEPDRAIVEKRVRAEADQLFRIFNPLGQKQMKIEDHIKRMINEEMRSIQRRQSAHEERGLLAIVAAFGDGRCVEMMEDYVRNYSGNRSLQAKSMLEVIPQIDDPRSLRVMCSLATSSRTAATRKKANEVLRDMSVLHGWTDDELAERTLPDAGFVAKVRASSSESCDASEPPEMILSYGTRPFRVIVNDDLEACVMQDDGKWLKDLPAAKKDDDKSQVRFAKAQLKSTREVLQKTKEALTERLFQAMCNRRTWLARDWRELLAGHVLGAIACKRLVWAMQSSCDAEPTFFQMQADGSTIDASGQRLEIADDWLISVAHPDQMEADVEQFWVNHLATQRIRPLFPQTCDAVSEGIHRE